MAWWPWSKARGDEPRNAKAALATRQVKNEALLLVGELREVMERLDRSLKTLPNGGGEGNG